MYFFPLLFICTSHMFVHKVLKSLKIQNATLQMCASRVLPGLQILSAANFVCNLCNRYLKLLQLFASAVLWCKDSCKYLQSLQIKVAYLTTKVSCNHWLQQLHPECNWTRNTSKSCSFGNQNIYSVGKKKQWVCTR